MPKPEGFFDPKDPLGPVTPPEAPAHASSCRNGGSTGGGGTGANGSSNSGGHGDTCRAAAAKRAGLRQLRSRLQRQSRLMGNFHGFNTYDIENTRKPAADRVDRLPGRPGRRLGPRQPALHVGRADARPHRLRHAGRRRDGEQGALPRRPHLRHQRPAEAEAGRRRADLPRLAHAHAGHRSEGQGQHLRLRIGHGPGASRRRARRLLGGDPKENPNTALFSIDVIKVPLAAPEKAAIVNRPRIFADRAAATSPACGRAAITAPARSAPR